MTIEQKYDILLAHCDALKRQLNEANERLEAYEQLEAQWILTKSELEHAQGSSESAPP